MKEMKKLATEYAAGTFRLLYSENVQVSSLPESGHWQELRQHLGRSQTEDEKEEFTEAYQAEMYRLIELIPYPNKHLN